VIAMKKKKSQIRKNMRGIQRGCGYCGRFFER